MADIRDLFDLDSNGLGNFTTWLDTTSSNAKSAKNTSQMVNFFKKLFSQSSKGSINSGVAESNDNGNIFSVNDDGSVILDGLQDMDFNGLINAAGAYLLGANPLINYEWSAKEAKKERDWQTQMSNTAYQRSVADMQAAGINPILAYSQGGASSGSGASASAPATSQNIGNTLDGISNLIRTVMKMDIKSDNAAASQALKFNHQNSARSENDRFNQLREYFNRYNSKQIGSKHELMKR